MEEDDVDLLKLFKNEDMDAFVENDDLDEDVIIAEKKSNEEDDIASNQIESDKMKEEEFVEKSENTRNPFLQLQNWSKVRNCMRDFIV